MELASRQADVARVTLASLVALHKAARSLPGLPRAIRATGGEGYLSPFRGRGMEYDESRPYQSGDDVRSLDWRVMARTGRPHTKVYREERERPVFCLVDYRSRMFFGTRGVFKHVLAAQLAALVAWRTVINGDRVGSVVYSDAEHHELRPGRGRAATMQFLQQLESAQDWAPSPENAPAAINNALARLRRLAKPGSQLMLFSDFSGLDETGRAHLAGMSRHNRLSLFVISDPIEEELPPPGRYPLTSGARDWVLDTRDRELARQHRERHLARMQSLRALCQTHGANLVLCSTRDNPQRIMQKALGGRTRT